MQKLYALSCLILGFGLSDMLCASAEIKSQPQSKLDELKQQIQEHHGDQGLAVAEKVLNLLQHQAPPVTYAYKAHQLIIHHDITNQDYARIENKNYFWKIAPNQSVSNDTTTVLEFTHIQQSVYYGGICNSRYSRKEFPTFIHVPGPQYVMEWRRKPELKPVLFVKTKIPPEQREELP